MSVKVVITGDHPQGIVNSLNPSNVIYVNEVWITSSTAKFGGNSLTTLETISPYITISHDNNNVSSVSNTSDGFFKWDGVSSSDAAPLITIKAGHFITEHDVGIFHDQVTNNLFIRASNMADISLNTALTSNVWVFLTFTYDGSVSGSEKIVIYMDGVNISGDIPYLIQPYQYTNYARNARYDPNIGEEGYSYNYNITMDDLAVHSGISTDVPLESRAKLYTYYKDVLNIFKYQTSTSQSLINRLGI
jgi:hypothetical protein